MLLTFDSFDCSGKTTLIDEFIKRYGGKVISPVLWSKGHQSTSPQFKGVEEHKLWSKSHYEMTTRMLTSGGRIDMIADRWIFTEKCYSPVMRKYQMNYYWKLDKLLKGNPMVLWVYPTILGNTWKQELKRRYVEKKESFVTFPQLLKIKSNFDKLYAMSNINKLRVDTSGRFTLDDILSKIHNKARSIDPNFFIHFG